MWLAAGYDSQSLRQLAALAPAEAQAERRTDRGDPRHQTGGGFQLWVELDQPGPTQEDLWYQTASAVLNLMPEALRSIGFDPGPADEEFRARCQNALDVVQHDLDTTGYGQFRMRATRGQGQYAIMFATLPDGSYWGGGEGMTRDLTGSQLLFSAAESVSATIEEVHELEWPVCAIHSDGPRTNWDPVTFIKKVPWWQCTRAEHSLAPVGQLTPSIARTL